MHHAFRSVKLILSLFTAASSERLNFSFLRSTGTTLISYTLSRDCLLHSYYDLRIYYRDLVQLFVESQSPPPSVILLHQISVNHNFETDEMNIRWLHDDVLIEP